jgi:tetratricopeptide (TPR) repeat protein
MKIIVLILLVMNIQPFIFSQTIEKPNFSTATHPLSVDRAEFAGNQFVLSLSIENQSETGYFCADKNIFIVDALSNKKYKLLQSKGIPVCPDTHYFKMVGEILYFQLFFPAINTQTKYISIVEECSPNCFTIKGVVLDRDLNKNIDLAFESYSSGNTELALTIFQQILKNYPDYPFGNLHFNIIQLYAEKNDMANAKSWYKKLNSSTFQDKNEVIGRLKQFSYYTKLIF